MASGGGGGGAAATPSAPARFSVSSREPRRGLRASAFREFCRTRERGRESTELVAPDRPFRMRFGVDPPRERVDMVFSVSVSALLATTPPPRALRGPREPPDERAGADFRCAAGPDALAPCASLGIRPAARALLHIAAYALLHIIAAYALLGMIAPAPRHLLRPDPPPRRAGGALTLVVSSFHHCALRPALDSRPGSGHCLLAPAPPRSPTLPLSWRRTSIRARRRAHGARQEYKQTGRRGRASCATTAGRPGAAPEQAHSAPAALLR